MAEVIHVVLDDVLSKSYLSEIQLWGFEQQDQSLKIGLSDLV